VVLDQGIDTSTAVGRLFFQIISASAEFEHALISERTMDGLAAARARGRIGGQEPKLGPRQVKLARQMYEETDPDGKRKHTVAQIAAEFGVSRPTIYRHLAKTTGSTAGLRGTFVSLFPRAGGRGERRLSDPLRLAKQVPLRQRRRLEHHAGNRDDVVDPLPHDDCIENLDAVDPLVAGGQLELPLGHDRRLFLKPAISGQIKRGAGRLTDQDPSQARVFLRSVKRSFRTRAGGRMARARSLQHFGATPTRPRG